VTLERCSRIRAERAQYGVAASLGESSNAPESVFHWLQPNEQQRVNPTWPKEADRFLDNFQEGLLADPQLARHDLMGGFFAKELKIEEEGMDSNLVKPANVKVSRHRDHHDIDPDVRKGGDDLLVNFVEPGPVFVFGNSSADQYVVGRQNFIVEGSPNGLDQPFDGHLLVALVIREIAEGTHITATLDGRDPNPVGMGDREVGHQAAGREPLIVVTRHR